MLHLHNQHMRGTRLDAIVATAVLLFILFLIVMLVGPVRTLAKERDEVRTEHVRELMTNVLQLELVDPEAYQELVTAVQAQGDLRFVIGNASCGGSHGPECSDAITSDECLMMGDYFPSLLVTNPPVDPRDSYYSPAVTGYYLATFQGELEVGACGAVKEPITLRKSLN
jgi:hypothetical protein